MDIMMICYRYACHCRSKRGLFHRANWTANMYRSIMCDIVFAVFDVIPEDGNRMAALFASFLSVYLILRQLRFTADDLERLQRRLEDLHRY